MGMRDRTIKNIDVRDLIKRSYSNKQCDGFEYQIQDKGNRVIARYEGILETNEWTLRVVLDRKTHSDSQCYLIRYQMPKSGLPLELIASTGLMIFNQTLKHEIQMKSDLVFSISETLGIPLEYS